MRTDRKGRIRLQSGDYRVGNFVFHAEPRHVKVTSSSGIVSWRVSLDTAIGILVEQAVRERKDNWLRTYAASTFSQLCVVPDPEFFTKHAALVNAQVAEHPEYYGKAAPTDDRAEDDRILEEERELHEATAGD